MRSHCVALLVLLTIVVQSAPAQELAECRPSRVTLRENKPVSAPGGYDQVFFFLDSDRPREIKYPLELQSDPLPSLTPDDRAIAKAVNLKESGRKVRLLWLASDGAKCLQDFDVVSDVPELVQLDATGIESRFVNPVRPVPIGSRPLQFFNNTGDRTFVVTIPFVYSATDLGSAYAVADYDRGRQVVSEIVCRVLKRNGKHHCKQVAGEGNDINAMDQLEGLRVLLEAVSNAKATSLEGACETPEDKAEPDSAALDEKPGSETKEAAKQDGSPAEPKKNHPTHLKSGGCIVESLFWTATCEMKDALVRFARTNEDEDAIRDKVRDAAPLFIKNIFEHDKLFQPPCDFNKAKQVQKEVISELDANKLKIADDTFEQERRGKISEPTDGSGEDEDKDKDEAVPFSYEVKSLGLKARFEAARIDMAKKFLMEAIRNEMEFPEASSRTELTLLQKLGLRKAPARFKEDIEEVFEKLERTRKELIDSEVENQTEKKILQCRLREVEAAGKLLASYSPDAYVPYSGIPETVLDDKGKSEAKECGDLADEMMQVIVAQRLNEQGIEVTDCVSDGTSTTCAATATIHPYQRATFSRSVLAHHPQPRIRFTISFFGETEIPANSNGYVTRGDAKEKDEKPKSEFGVQLGGDTSTSHEPDEALGIGLRHSGATGTLGFQYTGPVEASATVQYKTGDFGGAASSTKLDAVQYQAKVFGPKLLDRYAMTLQYGRLPFARPSSGIAVNVFGEGMQLAVGPASLGYIILRESANPEEIADTKNDDSDLWILQVKSIRIPLPFLRTVELVGLRGKDRKQDQEGPDDTDDGTTVAEVRPFNYQSVGGEIRWGLPPIPALGGSFAWYRSRLDVETLPGIPAARRDGQGTVWLARASWNSFAYPQLKELQQRFRPKYALSALVGRGTGDDKSSAELDEGYLGENAGFTNDMLFLSKVSKAFPDDIGIGLANKKYGGLQYTEERWSLLSTIARAIRVKESDIESKSTIVSAHGYEFVKEVHGRHWGGKELDVSFTLEAPKNIRWTLGAAYYWKSTAVKEVGATENLWSATAKLAITLSGR